MRGSDMVKGLYDDSEEIQAFRNHRLHSTAELRAKLGRVSAGAYASLRSAQHSLDLIHRETGNALAKDESARIEPTLRAFLASMERSEDSRVGQACVRTCRTRWLPDHKKKQK